MCDFELMNSFFRSNLCFSSFLESLDSLSANMEISVEPGSERKNQGAQLSSSCSQFLDNFTHLCFPSPRFPHWEGDQLSHFHPGSSFSFVVPLYLYPLSLSISSACAVFFRTGTSPMDLSPFHPRLVIPLMIHLNPQRRAHRALWSRATSMTFTFGTCPGNLAWCRWCEKNIQSVGLSTFWS